jgi:DNA polymerase I-like protein with 3'-5' exonuclease and polymerase domains
LVGYFAGSARYMRLAKLGVHDFLTAYIAHQQGLLPTGDLPDVGWEDTRLRAALRDVKARFGAIRPVAKQIVHSSAYGGTPLKIHGTQPELFPTVKAARDLQALYFEVCPEIRQWQNATVQEAAQAGYLRNPFGYVHWFWNVLRWTKVQGEWVSEWAEDAKAALAFKPQSTAAGIIKEAMLRIRDAGLAGYLRLQVHDSLVLNIPDRLVDSVGKAVVRLMTQPEPYLPLDPRMGLGAFLSIGVEAKAGGSWGEMKEVGW